MNKPGLRLLSILVTPNGTGDEQVTMTLEDEFGEHELHFFGKARMSLNLTSDGLMSLGYTVNPNPTAYPMTPNGGAFIRRDGPDGWKPSNEG